MLISINALWIVLLNPQYFTMFYNILKCLLTGEGYNDKIFIILKSNIATKIMS